MFRILFAALLAAAVLPAAASAAVFSRDWKTPGDGLLTYDDVNKREWLDLQVARLTNFPGNNPVERFQSLLGELGPSGRLRGFTLADRAALLSFAESAGIDPSTLEFTNQAATWNLISLVGATAVSRDGTAKWSIGWLADPPEPNAPPVERLHGDLFVIPSSGPSGAAGLRFERGFEPFHTAGLSAWLYRVPEPDSSVVIVVALLAWRGQARRDLYDRLSYKLTGVSSSAKGIVYGN